MADNVPTPQQPAPGSQNPVPAPAETQPQQPSPSLQEKATQQTQQAMQQAQQAMGQVQQTGQQITQGAQQMVGQAQQVTGQATQLFGQAAQLLTSKPTEPQPPVTQDEKIWAALSYVPMVALVSFLIKPKSNFVKLHGRQGLLLFLIFFFSIFLYIILPPLGPILGGLVQLGVFVIGIFSIYQAIMGNWWKTPVLGNIADMIPVEMFTSVTTQAITGQDVVQTQPVQPIEQVQPQMPVQTNDSSQNPPAVPPVQQ